MTYRLKNLQSFCLKYKRIRDLIQIYKLVHNIDSIDYNILFNYSYAIFNRADKFHKGWSTKIRHNCFIFKTVKGPY